jgi:hypothetical protein
MTQNTGANAIFDTMSDVTTFIEMMMDKFHVEKVEIRKLTNNLYAVNVYFN